MVEEILTPEVIASIVGLIVLVGGATAVGIIAGLRNWLIKGRDILTVLIDTLEDGKLTPDEIRKITKAITDAIKNDPELARQFLNKTE
jgi:hypothetical protein